MFGDTKMHTCHVWRSSARSRLRLRRDENRASVDTWVGISVTYRRCASCMRGWKLGDTDSVFRLQGYDDKMIGSA